MQFDAPREQDNPSLTPRLLRFPFPLQVPLPLGMVVNGVFRVEPSSASSSSCWLYAQTPHGHQGYVRYSACLPLGILATPAQCANAKTASSASTTTSATTRSASPSPSLATSSEMLPVTATRRHRRTQPLPTRAWGRGHGYGRGWGPTWDTASDIFPATLAGNQTDTDKARDTRSERFLPAASL